MRAVSLTSAQTQFKDFADVVAIRLFAIYQADSILMTDGFWMQRIAIG
jgi:hypothetical protein